MLDIETISRIKPYQYVITAIAMPLMVVSIFSLLFHGRVTYDYLLTGLVASLLASTVVGSAAGAGWGTGWIPSCWIPSCWGAGGIASS